MFTENTTHYLLSYKRHTLWNYIKPLCLRTCRMGERQGAHFLPMCFMSLIGQSLLHGLSYSQSHPQVPSEPEPACILLVSGWFLLSQRWLPRPGPSPPGCTGKEDKNNAGMTKALLRLPDQETGESRLCPRDGLGRADLGRTYTGTVYSHLVHWQNQNGSDQRIVKLHFSIISNVVLYTNAGSSVAWEPYL